MNAEKITSLKNKILTLKSFEQAISIKYSFDSQKFLYEPDSSRRAWEYFFVAYKNVFTWDSVQNEQLLKSLLFNEVFPPYSDEKAIQFWIGPNAFKRIIGTFNFDKEDNNIYFSLTSSKLIPEKNIGIGGDCSFNFNEKKIKYFWDEKVYKDKKVTPELKNIMYSLLKDCSEMHYSIFNFSLMPTTGGLNNVKGRGNTDQFDSFISRLNDYYRTAPEEKEKHAILTGVSIKYKDSILALKYFLDHQIGTLENYCQLFYHIDINAEKWNELLTPKNIEDCKSLLEYIELAVEFWEIQAKNYISQSGNNSLKLKLYFER